MAKRCFFSFHYQDVADFRANVVRNHNVTKDDNGGFFDASLWESTKRYGDNALKSLIDAGLQNTSVTVVLIGTETYARRWVQYEIFKSIERGNSLIGIHINGIGDRNSRTKMNGLNPFDTLGLYFSDDGRTVAPARWDGTQWIYHTDVGKFTKPFYFPEQRDVTVPLGRLYRAYDWVSDSGFANFATWVG